MPGGVGGVASRDVPLSRSMILLGLRASRVGGENDLHRFIRRPDDRVGGHRSLRLVGLEEVKGGLGYWPRATCPYPRFA
jgi:hypothetical protein